MSSPLTLYVRNSNLVIQQQIDGWSTLDMVLRFNDVGTWVLTMPADSQGSDEILQSGSGLIVQRDDGTVVFSGPVLRREENTDGNGDILTISGADDNIGLVRRIVHPAPATGNFASQAFDTRTGVASTVMIAYVNANLGPGALPARQIVGATMGADPGVGSTVTGQGRLQNLNLFLRDMALAGGQLGYKLQQSGSNLVFTVYAPVDRSASVLFDVDKGNLVSSKWSEEAPVGNYIYDGGTGDGVGRVFREGQDAASIATWGRVEEFLDSRSLSAAADMDQAIATQILTDQAKLAVAVVPIDLPSLSYGTQYGLGDIVTAVIREAEISAIVQSVDIKVDSTGGFVAAPTIGTPGTTQLLSLFSQLRRAERKVSVTSRN